jgi:hypothetical protein
MSTIRLSFSFALEIGNTKGLSINVEGGMYKGELNQLEVESGYGMGMALPSSTRHTAGQSKVRILNRLAVEMSGPSVICCTHCAAVPVVRVFFVWSCV